MTLLSQFLLTTHDGHTTLVLLCLPTGSYPLLSKAYATAKGTALTEMHFFSVLPRPNHIAVMGREASRTLDRRAMFSSSSSLSFSCSMSSCSKPCDKLKDSLNRRGVEQLESVSLSSEAMETIRSSSSFLDSSCCSWLTCTQTVISASYTACMQYGF